MNDELMTWWLVAESEEFCWRNSVEGKRENDEWSLDEMIHSAVNQKKLLKTKWWMMTWWLVAEEVHKKLMKLKVKNSLEGKRHNDEWWVWLVAESEEFCWR